jgi:hypothetical protein
MLQIKKREKYTNKDYYLLACGDLPSGRSLPKFMRKILPQSSGSK